MNATLSPAPEVVDLADLADDIFTYQLQSVRRTVVEPDDQPAPSPLEYEPELTEFVD